MVDLRTLDPTTPMPAQLSADVGPVTVINTFFVPGESTADFLKGWAHDAALMRTRPGFINTQMYQGIAGSQLLINVATWESTGALGQALRDPEFRRATAELPDGVIAYPHVFQKLAVDGVCTA